MEKMQILFPEPQLSRLRQLSRAEDRPVSELIRSVVDFWLARRGDVPAERAGRMDYRRPGMVRALPSSTKPSGSEGTPRCRQRRFRSRMVPGAIGMAQLRLGTGDDEGAFRHLEPGRAAGAGRRATRCARLAASVRQSRTPGAFGPRALPVPGGRAQLGKAASIPRCHASRTASIIASMWLFTF